MLGVAVVGCDAALVTLAMADNHVIGKRIEFELLAQFSEQFHRFCVCSADVSLSGLGIKVYPRTAAGVLDAGGFGHFNTDMGVIGVAARVPATIVPREGLVHSVGFDKAVGGFLYTGLVPTLDKYLGFGLGSTNGVQHQPLGAFVLELLITIVDASQVVGIHIVLSKV